MQVGGIIFGAVTASAATFGAATFAFAAQPTTAPVGVGPTRIAPSPIERANADAVARLYAQIAGEQVGGVPVSQLVERVHGHRIMIDGLSRAEQIGGPREVSDELVQVKLQISGTRAAQLLLQAATVRPENSPIPPERLAFLLQDWNRRTFTSTGDSIDADERTRIVDDPHTRRVQAFETDPSASESASRPGSQPTATPATRVTLREPPEWTGDPIVAAATAPAAGSPLRTARAAEAAARDAIRKRIDGLPLDAQHTVADLSRGDEAVRRAVDASVDAAKVAGVDYRGDGSVEVRIALDGQQVWQSIRLAR